MSSKTFEKLKNKATEIRSTCFTSVKDILKNAVVDEKLSKKDALAIMNKYITLMNAKMSLPKNAPTAASFDQASDRIIIEEKKGLSLIYNRKAWSLLDENAQKAEMSKDYQEDDSNQNRISKAVNGSMLTFGQAISFILGKVPIIVNADKHLNAKGEFKKIHEHTEGKRRKFAFVDHEEFEDVFLCIAYKTYISFLNSIISKNGEINIPKKNQQNQVEWAVRDKETKFKKIPIYNSVLKDLISNKSVIYNAETATVTCLAFKKSSDFFIFGCYQVPKENVSFRKEIAFLKLEFKKAYDEACENLKEIEEF
jgi:hypothetical protein